MDDSTQGINIGDLTIGVGFEVSEADLKRLLDTTETRLNRKLTIPVGVDTGRALPELAQVRAELEKLAGQGTKASREQVAASRALEAQYKTTGTAQVQAARAAAAESAANAAKLREQSAAYSLNARMAAQARRDEKARSDAAITALDNEQRAYRNLWQGRQINDDQSIQAQRRIYQQALMQAQAVDKQSDAYRRLTQIIAASQRTIDSAQGINTPGGFASGVTQGILSAVGNLGPFGQLLEQVVRAGFDAAEEEARQGAQDVARQAGAGLQSGLAGQTVTARKAGYNLGKSVQDGAEDALDIQSPSRVMKRVGAYAGDGLADGLLSKRAEVSAAAKSLANAVEQNARPNISANVAPLNALSGGGVGGSALPAVAVLPSAQAGLSKVAAQAALTTAALGGATLAVGALTVGFTNGVQKAAQYEQGLAELSVLTDKLPSQMGATGQAILKLTTDVGVSFGELKSAYAEILGASLKGTENEQDALNFLATSARLAKVTLTDTRTAADALTSVLSAYGKSAADATAVSDLLFSAVKAGKVSLTEISSSLGAVASQANSLNVPLDELLGGMALLTTRGIPAGTALEYIRSALSNVQKPSAEAASTAKSLGVAFDALSLKRLGLIGFLDQLGKGVGDNSEAMATLIGDVGGLQAVLGLLAGGMGDTKRILNEVRDSTGSVSDAFDKLKGTATQNVSEFRAATDRLQIALTTGLLPTFTKFLDALNPVLIALGDFVTKLDQVKSPGELKATLKIESGDDETTKILKLLVGGAEATRQATTTARKVPGVGAVADLFSPATRLAEIARILAPLTQATAQRDQARDLRNALVDAGALPKAGGAALDAQIKEVQDKYAHYQAVLADALVKQGQAIDRATGRVPVNTLQPLTGAGPLLPGQTRAGAPTAQQGNELGQVLAGAAILGIKGETTSIAGECSKFVRQVFESAFKRVAPELFGATAKITEENFRKAGLSRKYTGPDDLKAGDVVFNRNDPSGAGHTGIVVVLNGTKFIAENSSAVARANNGDARGLTPLNRFGGITSVASVNGYAPIGGTPAQQAAAAKDPNADLKKTLEEGRHLINQYRAAILSGDDIWKAKAKAALDQFKKDNKDALGGLDAELKALAKVTAAPSKASGYGQQFDALKGRLAEADALNKLNDNAQAYIKSLDGISTAAKKAAEAEKAKNGETAKYRALLDLAGDTAAKARSAREAQGRDAEATAREQERQQREAAQRAQARQQSQRTLQDVLSTGNVGNATRALTALKQQQADELSLYKDNEGKKAQIIAQTGPQIVAAAQKVADLKRDIAIKAARREADDALKVEGADPAAIEKTRVAKVAEAYRVAAQERAAAAREQKADITTSNAALEAQARQQIAAQVAISEAVLAAARERQSKVAAIEAAARQGRIKDAQLTLEALTAQRDQELKDAGDNAAKKLAIETAYQQDVLKASRAILQAQYRDAVAAAQARNDANTDADIKRAERERNQASRALGNASTNRVNDAATATAIEAASRNAQSQLDAVSVFTKDRAADLEAVAKNVAGVIKVADIMDGLTENALNRFIATLSGTVDEQIAQTLRYMETITSPELLQKFKDFVTQLRAELPQYPDPVAAGLIPGANGFAGQGTGNTAALTAATLASGLREAVNPTEVQGYISEIITLLASDVADTLPQSVRDGLTAGVQDAQAYLDALAGITEEAVKDGFNRAQNAAPAPTNRFDEFNTRLLEMGTVTDPEALRGLGEALDTARQKGELTADQLVILKGVLDGLSVDPLDAVTKGFDEAGNRIFYTEQELKELGATTGETTQNFYDLDNALRNVGRLSQTELDALIEQSFKGTEAADKLRAAWQNVQDAITDAKLDARELALGPATVFNAGARADLSRDREAERLARAQRTFNEEVKGLEAGMPAYEAAQLKLENARTRAAKEGAQERLDILASEADALVGYAQQLGSIFDKFNGGQKSSGGILADYVSLNVDSFKKFQSGDVVGAVLGYINGLLGIGDALANLDPKFAAYKKNLLEVAEAQKAAMGSERVGGRNGFLNPYYEQLRDNAAALEQTANASIWQRVGWALFGGAPEILGEEASKTLEEASYAFQDLGANLYSTLQDTLLSAIDSGDFSGVNEALGRQLDKFVQKAAIDAVIAKSNLQNLIKAFADEFAAGGDTTDELAAIRAEIDRVSGTVQAIAPSLPGYGAGTDKTSGPPTGSLFGAAPSAQLGIPRLEVTLPDSIMRPLGEFASAVPVFAEGSTRLLQAANLIVDSFRRGQMPGQSPASTLL